MIFNLNCFNSVTISFFFSICYDLVHLSEYNKKQKCMNMKPIKRYIYSVKLRTKLSYRACSYIHDLSKHTRRNFTSSYWPKYLQPNLHKQGTKIRTGVFFFSNYLSHSFIQSLHLTLFGTFSTLS